MANSRVILVAVLSAASWPEPASAQEFPLNYKFSGKERCAYYRTVFDHRSKEFREHPDYGKAIYWRVKGGEWCVTGHTVAGQNALKGALNILGIGYKKD